MAAPITIIGGGLAGLALGIRLRARGVPVTLHEAGAYPRARVCGEFLCGISRDELRMLGIDDLFARACLHRSTAWFRGGGGKPFFQAAIPGSAYGISRDYLDHALAGRFEACGGTLLTGSRQAADTLAPTATVWAAGRTMRKEGPWVGLKCHLEDFQMHADLEVHLGDNAYIGLSRVEDGRVNCCGLFRMRPGEASLLGRREDPAQRMAAAMEVRGFPALADRLARVRGEPGSMVGIHRFALGWQRSRQVRGEESLCRLGDAAAIIPPFTGNGMSMALQSALLAAPMVEAFSLGQESWHAVCERIELRQQRMFSRRMRWAVLTHPLLLSGSGHRLFAVLAGMRLLPFKMLFRMTHH